LPTELGETIMPLEYDVFLSHNSKDKPAVETIANLLQQSYQIKCWLDKWKLVPGEPSSEALRKLRNVFGDTSNCFRENF
jgi:hypothetical protein